MADVRKPTDQLDPALAPIVDELRSTFSQSALREIEPAFARGIKSASQVGSKLTITRNETKHIPLDGEFLNGNIKMKSLDIGDIKCDIDRVNHTASNIEGISINLTVFGTPYAMDVKQARLGFDASGAPVLYTELENPVVEPAQRILGMPPTISVNFPVGENRLVVPNLSEVFSGAATKTGPSIAGLLAADALNEASKISLFVESNPEWINNIAEPVARGIYKTLADRMKAKDVTPTPSPPAFAQPAPGQPPTITTVDATGKVIQIANPAAFANAKPHDKVGDHTYKLPIEGAERNFKIHVPPSYNGKTPMPMIILLHGQGQDGEEIARWTKFNEMADKKGFIAIYPDSRKWAGRDEWRTWDADNGLLPPGQDANDVAFMRKIIETAEKDYLVDPKRIYMAGLSNGGMLAFRAAGELSDKLAAVAVVSSAMSGSEPPLRHPVSLLNIHGTADRIIPYDGLKNVPGSLKAIGLPSFKSTQYATEYWVDQNKIQQHPIILKNNEMLERKFLDTKTGTEVREISIQGSDHIPENFDKLTATIWDFFEAHPKTTGDVSGKPQPPQEQPFNLADRVRGHINTRGMKGMELDAGQVLNEVRNISDGSFSPSTMLSKFESKSGILLNDSVSNLLKNTVEVSKDKDNIAIDMGSPQTISVANGGSGPVRLNSINIDDTKFELKTENNLPVLKNVSGVSFNLRALGRDVSVGVTEAAQKVDGSGNPYYRLKAVNPMGSVARTLLLADKEVPVELQLHQSGATSILNQKELKDAVLGVNPISRGYIDIGSHMGELYQTPSWANGLDAGKDLGIMGVSTYGGLRLATKLKLGTKGRVGAAVTAGLVVAPAIIHGIERLRD